MPKHLQVKIFLVVFVLMNLFLSSFFIDAWTTPNTVSRALPILTFFENGSLKIDPYANQTGDKSKVGDHYYSDKAPFPTFAMIPIYGVAKIFGIKADSTAGKHYPVYIWKSMSDADGRQWVFSKIVPLLFLGSFFLSTLPFTLIILLTFLAIKQIQISLSPVLMVMLAFYGSYIFVFSGTYFGHVCAGCLLLVSYIFLKREKYFLSGLFLGLSFLSEYTVALAFPLWLLMIYVQEKSFKKPALFFMGMLPSILTITIYNYLTTGHPEKMLNAYHDFFAFKELGHYYGFSFPSLESLWGLSFSSYMGIFFFTPVLLMALYYAIKKALTKNIYQEIKTSYLMVFAFAFFLLISSFFTWWGGWSYGPRYLIPLSVLLVYEGVIFLSKVRFAKIIYVLLTLFGLATAWLAKSTLMFMIPDKLTKPTQYLNPIMTWLVPAFKKGYYNSNNLFTLLFDMDAKTSIYLWLFLFAGTIFFLDRWYQSLVSQNIIEIKTFQEIQKQDKKVKNKKAKQ